jgi:hypothetical protein
VAQNGKCGLCEEKFTDYTDIVPDHINPRGIGRAWRDDHPDNIQAAHWWCNGETGVEQRVTPGRRVIAADSGLRNL